MKDGTQHELVLQYCRNQKRAKNLIVKIRSNKNFRESTRNDI